MTATTLVDSIADVARSLRDAERLCTPVEPIRDQLPSRDVDAAYSVQEHNVAHALASGRRLVGRKIGLTAAAIQRQLGVDQPDFGALFADMCFADGEPLPVERLIQPRAEAEVALVLSSDLDMPEPTVVDVVRSVAFALPAIEIVDSRIAGWDIEIVDTIADNASCGLVVLGSQPVPIDAFDHRLCGMVLELDGAEASVGAGAACLGSPINAARWLARRMVAVGTPLTAGDVLITGALGPMIDVAPGHLLEARIEGLGVVRADLTEVTS